MTIVNDKDVSGSLAKAKVDAMKSIKRLEKLHANKHGGYAFASIDDFKDEIRPILAANGIDVWSTEDGFDLIQVKTKSGESTYAKVRFKFVLIHVSGDSGLPFYFTVCMPYTGAQTSGAALSYAMKEAVYKGQFQASSGDINEEADLQIQSSLQDNVDRLSKAEAKPLYEALQLEMRAVETEERDSDAMRRWWSDNAEQLNIMPRDWFEMLKKEWTSAGRRLVANEEADRKARALI